MGWNPESEKFEQFDRAEDIPRTHAGPFSVGELFPWKGIWFEVAEIREDAIVLKPRKRT